MLVSPQDTCVVLTPNSQMAFAPTFARRFAATSLTMSNVFFDITKNGSPLGTIKFKLFDE